MRFPNLFTPGNIGECHLKNRIIMPLFPTKYATDSRVIFAINAVPEDSLVDDLKGRVKQVMDVGDAELPGNLGAAPEAVPPQH